MEKSPPDPQLEMKYSRRQVGALCWNTFQKLVMLCGLTLIFAPQVDSTAPSICFCVYDPIQLWRKP